MTIKPSIALLSALLGFNALSFSSPSLSAANAVSAATQSMAPASQQPTVSQVSQSTDLVIIAFHDTHHAALLKVYHHYQTNGDDISAEQLQQAENLLTTLSQSFGSELNIARIARLGAVVFKLNEAVELADLNQRLQSSLASLAIVKYAEPDPYLSINALQSFEDDAYGIIRGLELKGSRTPPSYIISSIRGANIEAGQESLTNPQLEPWGYRHIQAEQLSDAAADQLTVCIVDSGYDTSHPDLPQSTVTGSSAGRDGDNWYDDAVDAHGSHVAGIIAALDNQVGSKGVLPNGKINLIIKKWYGAGFGSPLSTIADLAVDCANEGANLINLSLANKHSTSASQYVIDAFNEIANKNVLSIAAAGNDGKVEEPDSSFHYVPASLDSVIAVGSIDEDNQASAFSNKLLATELVAPGRAVYSTVRAGAETLQQYMAELSINGELYPNFIANKSIESLDLDTELVYCGDPDAQCTEVDVEDKICIAPWEFDNCYYRINSEGRSETFSTSPAFKILLINYQSPATYWRFPGLTLSLEYQDKLKALSGQTVTLDYQVKSTPKYSYMSGTSMAAPYATGAAALAWSNNLDCTAAEVRTALNATAIDLGEPGRDTSYGYGLVQAKSASDYMRENCAAYQSLDPVDYSHVSLKTVNDKYIVAEVSGTVLADRTALGPWELFNMVDVNGGQLISGDEVQFTSHHGDYLGVSGTNVIQDASTPETFIIESTTGETVLSYNSSVAIKATNGLYLKSTISGALEVVSTSVVGDDHSCVATEPGCGWNVFELIINHIATFKSADDKYVVAQDDTAVRADRTAIGPWEQFIVVDLNEGELVSGDSVYIRSLSHSTPYVSRVGTNVYASSYDEAAAETFILEKTSGESGKLEQGDSITIKASNDLYLQAKVNGELDADGDAVEGSEKSCDATDTSCGWTVFELVF